MGLTCKPIGENKSIMTRLQNRINEETKAREEVKRKKREK